MADSKKITDSIVQIAGTINPIMTVALMLIGQVRTIFAAFKSSYPDARVDLTTGTVYVSEAAALAAGALKENLAVELPSDAELIAAFAASAEKLVTNAEAARRWLRESMGLLDAPHS